jgi:hypothetical protein
MTAPVQANGQAVAAGSHFLGVPGTVARATRRERLSSNTFERSVALAGAAGGGSCELTTDVRALSAVLGVIAPETADKSVRQRTVCWVDAGDHTSGVTLAELVAALSLATDLGLGQPQEHVLRPTVIARRLAAAAGLPYEQQTAVFYVSLLAWVGCVSDSHELATWFGDDQRLRADSYEVDKTGTSMLRFVLGHVGEGLRSGTAAHDDRPVPGGQPRPD